MSEWFSDAALEKQAALKRGEGTGDFRDLIGIWEPRTQPEDHEQCHQCDGDARDGAGGDWHFCGLHVGRDYVVPFDCPGGECDRTPPDDHESSAGQGGRGLGGAA